MSKQPSPIEEIIDNAMEYRPKAIIDFKNGEEALRKAISEQINCTMSSRDMMLILNTISYMQQRIETLTADNLQLMQQIEARGKCV